MTTHIPLSISFFPSRFSWFTLFFYRFISLLSHTYSHLLLISSFSPDPSSASGWPYPHANVRCLQIPNPTFLPHLYFYLRWTYSSLCAFILSFLFIQPSRPPPPQPSSTPYFCSHPDFFIISSFISLMSYVFFLLYVAIIFVLFVYIFSIPLTPILLFGPHNLAPFPPLLIVQQVFPSFSPRSLYPLITCFVCPSTFVLLSFSYSPPSNS